MPGIMAARRFYDEPMAAFSVAATEHSVTTSWGREGEQASIDYMIENMMPEGGILSMVADTYNVYEFTRKIAEVQHKIAAKKGTLVIRPDSGDMKIVLPQIFNEVRDKFWSIRNEKGYCVPKYVKVLQGDGINEHTCTVPFQIAQEKGISADAVMVGSGGGLMQSNIDRDTCKFAFKASNVTRDGVDVPIAKEPITDPGKRSKMGRLKLCLDEERNEYFTFASESKVLFDAMEDQLRTVYEDGETYSMESLAVIRDRLAKQ